MLSKRLWAVLLVGVLVVGLLVGFGGGDEAVAKEPRATLGKIMVPAAAFIPNSGDWNYSNDGDLLSVSGFGEFLAPLSFPVPEVNIRKITLIAWDDRPGQVCVSLKRAEPLIGSGSFAGGTICTVKSPANPQKIATNAINPRRVNTVNHGSYLAVSISGTTYFYGVQVVYSY